MLVDAFVLF